LLHWSKLIAPKKIRNGKILNWVATGASI